MSRIRILLAVLCIASTALITAPAAAGSAAKAKPDKFELYTGVVTSDQARDLQQRYDHDVVGLRKLQGDKHRIDVILNGVDKRKLADQGISLKAKRDNKGRTATQAATAKLREGGSSVFRKYSGKGGIAQEIRALAARNPDITKLVVIGHSINEQPILALKVTKNAKRVRDGSRSAALYLGTQHAREWISPEVTRRLMHHFVEGFRTPGELRQLISRNEYWFVPVANPDGYDWTFEPGNRLWRKNLRDNNGDGVISADADGVDPNRNFATNWGYDNEGSSTVIGSQTYRGTGPASEPETQALDGLMARIGFNYLVNYHSAAELLLYGVGWQVNTHTPDDLAYETLAGDDADPAIEGFDPDLSAELYTTNGDTTDHAHEAHGTLAFTPELTRCQTVAEDASTCESGFNFPDDEGLVQAEFDKNLPFAMDVARSKIGRAHV